MMWNMVNFFLKNNRLLILKFVEYKISVKPAIITATSTVSTQIFVK